jgi:hypothetical protein
MGNDNPQFPRIVRQIFTFPGTADVTFAVNSATNAEASFYGLASRGWYTVRVRGVTIWGPKVAAAAATMVIDVFNYNSSGSAKFMTLTDEVDATNTADRPVIAWKYGEIVSTVSFTATNTNSVFTILQASPAGVYVVDWDVVYS